ncbi:MAG TPA: hypothetical protein VEW42_02580, partial [Candidatus Eisenbacteria bacterium]|nr:hypothetical protein [Candidatus Eisenbacteria bacterium]
EKQGYTQAAIEELTEILPDETHSIITTSKSKKQAQEYLHFLSEEYGLCKKLLGLEKGKGACFAYRLEKCKGACIGKENPLAYNARCIIAFSQQKIKRWPFSGPVIFYEENEFTNSKDEFLVDKWCLLGKRSRVDDLQNDFETKDYRFDMDTYKILLQFVKNHAKNKKFGIIPLENNKLQNI